jgi:phage gpG-like protein
MKVEIRSDAAVVLSKVKAYPQVLTRVIADAMDRRNLLTVGYIIATKLTAAGPKFLNRQTGRLGGSARATKSVIAGAVVSSSIGTNVKYGAVHEYGFKGTVSVAAFTRKNPQADRFTRNGVSLSRRQAEGFFGKNGRPRAGVIKATSGVSFVRAYKRKMNMPARHMFSTGIEEQLPAYREDLSDAIVRAWEASK